jgi:DNA mismatch repair protein MutS
LVKQKKDQLFFCRSLVVFVANKSYGIEAAKLAGVPKEVINKARLVLDYLEKNNQLNSQIKIK